MAINYIDPSTNESVEKESWRWVAVYSDDTQLEQFEIIPGKAVFHKFAEIDQSKLQTFKMVHDTHPSVIIHIPNGAKLVHAYVNGVHQTQLADGEHVATEKYKGYKVGYQLNGNDYGVMIDYDNSIQLLSKFSDAIVARHKIATAEND